MRHRRLEGRIPEVGALSEKSAGVPLGVGGAGISEENDGVLPQQETLVRVVFIQLFTNRGSLYNPF